jgi:hypothetical protein
MLIKIARNGKVIGDFESKEIPWRLEQGVLLNTDHYWVEGMQEWKPLKDFVQKPTMQSDSSAGGGLWNMLTLGLFSGLAGVRSGRFGDADAGWNPQPGPIDEVSDEEMDEQIADDLAEDERELMADNDDGDYDGDGGDGDA